MCSVTAGRNPAEKKKKGKPGAQEHGKDKKETQMQKVGRAAGRKEKNRLKGEAQTEGGNGKERPEGVGRIIQVEWGKKGVAGNE